MISVKGIINNICKELFIHIRRLNIAYRIKGEDSILMKDIVSKLKELYSISEYQAILNYAKRLTTMNKCIMDKAIKLIILKEFNKNKRDNSIFINLPHAQIIDHNVCFIINNRR